MRQRGERMTSPEEQAGLKRLQAEAFEAITTCVYCSQRMTFRQWCDHIVDCTRRLYNDRERATYHYAVMAKAGATESGYSNDATATVPSAPGAPTLGSPTESLGKPDLPIYIRARVEWREAGY